MDEEEDWDAPPKSPTKTTQSQQSNSTSTPLQTLKITDGFKYSYEALSSPANIDDWVEPPSYGGSRRSSNGFFQNSFKDRDNNRSFRNDRSGGNKRFDTLKRNDSFNSPRNFGTPKPSKFENRSLPNPLVEDWDAPDASSNNMNGSWKPNFNITVNTTADENWDDPEDAAPSHKATPKPNEIPLYKPNQSSNNSIDTSINTSVNNSAKKPVIDDEEDWDAPTPTSSKSDKPQTPTIPLYKPSSSSMDTSSRSIEHNTPSSSTGTPINSTSKADDDEDWDDEPSGAGTSTPKLGQSSVPFFKPDNSNSSFRNSQPSNSTNAEEDWDAEESGQSATPSYAENSIPLYKPNNPNGNSFSNKSINQRYENNFHSNKFPTSRGFDTSDRPRGFDSNDRQRGFDTNDRKRGFDSHDRQRGFDSNDRQRGFDTNNRQRGFDSKDRFERDPFTRHSRGNRHAPYDRGGGRGFRDGRGGRGGRGGRDRDGRDSGHFQPYFNSRDHSRNRNDRGDRPYQNSFNRNKNNDRPSFAPPPMNFNKTVVEPEEDWDSPTGFKITPAEESAPPPAAPIVQQNPVEEESWD